MTYDHINYREYLKSGAWKAKRQEVIKSRKNKKCDLCNIRDANIIHHREGYRNLGKEDPQELSLVCQDCHEKLHFTKKGNKIHLTEKALKQRWHDIYISYKRKKVKVSTYPPLNAQEKEQLDKEKAFAFRHNTLKKRQTKKPRRA